MKKMGSTNIDELFQRTTINHIMPSFVEEDGFLMGCNYKKIKDRIDNLEVKDSDIWVTSYPKSGTTWTQEMVWLIANNLDFEGTKEQQISRFPFLEMEMLYDLSKCDAYFEDVTSEQMRNSVEYVNKLTTNPRCIKTHLPWGLLPKSIQNKEKLPKIIFVCRNPKDVCVSYYHHHKLLHHFNGNFEEFATLFLHDKVVFSPFWRYVEGFWERRNEPNVLVIKYEEMKRDLRSVVSKVAHFLDKAIPDDKMDQLLNHLSFKSMKENDAVNYRNVKRAPTAYNGEFMRKGIVGDYKNQMTPELIEKFDLWIKENNQYGITF